MVQFVKDKILWLFVCLTVFNPITALAKNPWMGEHVIDPGNLQQTVKNDTIETLRTACMVSGCFLLAYCVRTLWMVIMRDADERKEHGNSVMSILIAVLAAVIGMILLGIAWNGLDAGDAK